MGDHLETLSSNSTCYYGILGLCKQASNNEIRRAYRSLALKWHPDRWIKDPKLAGEAKRRFQQIQEAYSVLSDKGKRSVYDAGLYDLLLDDDDENFEDFMQEMAATIKRTRCQQVYTFICCFGMYIGIQTHEGNNLEELQKMLIEMIGCDYTSNSSMKKTRTS
ncbi:uncharacterized protein LOC110727662 [Chenopodium quinoa]|uniref:uncharacterized protein LOC110727662 n=1 Tax=Chenopodium quinoa TaxID=63459 RepID=UPI000B7808A9|nr:uncharacterized protein LOC110727662 [Chenopodium quinoa]